MFYIASDYSASECVCELRKFIGTFGVSSEIISDKRSTFENKVVAQFLIVIDIKWTPNLETARFFFFAFFPCRLKKILVCTIRQGIFSNNLTPWVT